MTAYNTVNQLPSPGGSSTATIQDIYRNPLPAFEGKFAYTSDSCGKVGPWQLLAELDGFYGQIRHITDWTNAAVTNPTFRDKDTDEWIVDFKLLIPIIPEKNGNKTSALYADGEIFAAEGAGLGGNWMANANGTFNNQRVVTRLRAAAFLPMIIRGPMATSITPPYGASQPTPSTISSTTSPSTRSTSGPRLPT